MSSARIMALFGGLTAALGHAPFHFWYLALPGFAALIWSVSIAPTPGRAFRMAWLAGTAYFAVTLHWIVEPFLVDAATHGWMAPFALILLAGGLGLLWGGAGWAAARLSDTQTGTALAFVVTLTAVELMRGHLFTGFPWAMPAYVWAETPVRAAVAYTGSYGLTALTLLGAALAVASLRFRLGPALALLFFGGLYGLGEYRIDYRTESNELGRVGIVHPSIPQTEKWNREEVSQHIDLLFNLSARSQTGAIPVDLVVWPEVAVVYPLDQAGGILASASEAVGGTPLILGINRRDGEDWFNSLIQVGANGTVSEVYDKVHLVPFGEYIPFQLGFLRAMAATTSNGFSSGERVRLIDTPLGRALPLICYEGIFPGHVFKAGERADYMLLITNDAWFGTFAGPEQHFDQARFRAAEHGLPVVRVSNTGTSGVIDRFGVANDRISRKGFAYDDQAVWSGPPTLYARTGDWPLLVVLFVTLSALLIAKRRNGIAKGGVAS